MKVLIGVVVITGVLLMLYSLATVVGWAYSNDTTGDYLRRRHCLAALFAGMALWLIGGVAAIVLWPV